MSAYNPPIENVPIFDSALFRQTNTDDALTSAQADKRYLRFPIAQGTENLSAINVNGSATFTGTSDIIQESGSQILQQPASTGVISSSNILNASIVRTNFGSSTNTSLQIIDTSSKGLYVVSNAINNAYNNIVQTGDAVITSVNTTPLSLTNSSSSFTNGIRLDTTQLSLGYGGTADVPSTLITCNASTVNVSPSLTFPDTRVQNSAFTGAGPLAGSYTNTNMTIDSNGKISAISNGSGGGGGGSNITPSSIVITPTTGAISTSGIFNQFNAGALYSLYDGTNTAYNSNWTPTRPLKIRFVTNSGGAVPNTWGGWITLEVNFWFASTSGGAIGQTTCTLMLFGNALKSNWGSLGSTIYNINNKIDGNDAYFMSNGSAPFGRQYYTYNQTFSGISGANAYLSGSGTGTSNYTVQIYFQMPSVSVYSYNCKIIDVSALSTSNMGVEIFS